MRVRRLAARVVVWGALLGAGAALHAPLFRRTQPALPRAVASLVEEAAAGLRDREAPFDYGGFFLRTEAVDRRTSASALLWRWHHQVEAMRRDEILPGQKHHEVNVLRVLSRLFRESNLESYRRDEARMSAFFDDEDPGGNCEAQTKLLVAAVTASGLTLPDGMRLGVQVFGDHVQAVVLDVRRRRVWNLLTGARLDHVDAPIFEPAILLSAYLRGRGLEPAVGDAELLLAAPPSARRAARGTGFRTTSSMRFPASAARFSDGPTPERASVPFPLPAAAAQPASSAQRTGAARDAPPTVALSREEFLRHDDVVHLYAMDQARAPFGLPRGRLVFADAEDAARYNAEPRPDRRRELLLGLAETALSRELGSGLMQGAPQILGAHARRRATNGAVLSRTFEAVLRVEALTSLTEYVLRETFGDGPLAAAAVHALEARVPRLADVRSAVRTMPEAVGSDPSRLLRELGELDHAQRAAFLGFLTPRFPANHTRALARVIADPHRVSLVADGGVPARSRDADVVWMEVDLLDLPEPPSAAAPVTAASAAKPPASAASVAPAPAPTPTAEPLSVAVYLDVVLSGLLSYGEPDDTRGALGRWDAFVSTSYLHGIGGRTDACRERVRFAAAVLGSFDGSFPKDVDDVRVRLSALCP